MAERMTYYIRLKFIMAWFHSHYTKTSNMLEVEQMFTEMTEALPKPPKRMRITQFYSKRFYDTRIKPVFESEWAAVSASAGDPKRSRINTLNSVTTRLWENEPSSFKTWLESQRDAEHARELAEHQTVVKELENAPSTPETYHAYVPSASVWPGYTNNFLGPLTTRARFFSLSSI